MIHDEPPLINARRIGLGYIFGKLPNSEAAASGTKSVDRAPYLGRRIRVPLRPPTKASRRSELCGAFGSLLMRFRGIGGSAVKWNPSRARDSRSHHVRPNYVKQLGNRSGPEKARRFNVDLLTDFNQTDSLIGKSKRCTLSLAKAVGICFAAMERIDFRLGYLHILRCNDVLPPEILAAAQLRHLENDKTLDLGVRLEWRKEQIDILNKGRIERGGVCGRSKEIYFGQFFEDFENVCNEWQSRCCSCVVHGVSLNMNCELSSILSIET